MILMALFPLVAMGQKPFWTESYFKELSNSYLEVVSAFDYSLSGAKLKAENEVKKRRSMATGTETNVRIDDKNLTIQSEHDLIVKSRIIDEYVQRTPNGYTVYLLVQTAKNPTFEYEPVSVTDRYPFSARVFVPGMAQLHKGSTVKGSLFIGGEVAAIGGIVAFECLRSSYDSKINRTHNAAARKDYMNKADNMKNIRNGFIAGAAAIYLWNIIDGIVGKGKKHVEVGEAAMYISPYAMPQSAGVSLCLNF